MNLKTFYAAAKAEFKDISVFYDHIDVEQQQGLYPPFLVIREVEFAPFHADNCNYWMAIQYELLAFTPTRSATLRKQIKDFLDKNGISYDLTPQGFDADSNLFTDQYTLGLEGDNDV